MKVLLTTINSKYIHQNLAIRLLYELNKDYKSIHWKEFFSKQDSEEIAQYCHSFDLVAFSVYIWNITKTIQIGERIKQLNPKCLILLGGPEVTYEWDYLTDFHFIDFIITGEGEIPFKSLLRNFPELDHVPSLVWKKNGCVVHNPDSGAFNLIELENINPYKNEPVEDLINKICYLESSRGCPCHCSFCLAGLENKLRYLPQHFIESNLIYLMQNGRIIKFLDRTFNANPDFAISIFSFILEHYKPGNIFQFEIKADVLQPKLIDFIQKKVPAGLFRFEIGIQTLNSRANDAIKRKQNFNNTKKFIEHVSQKVELHLDLIVGLPFDYYEDIKFSFEEVFKLFAPELQLGFLKLLKGTPIRNESEIHGYYFDQLPPYQIVSSNYLTENEVQRIILVEEALEILWNKKKIVLSLKHVAHYYSIFDYLLEIGLFISQNGKTGLQNLDNFYELVYGFSEKKFPEDVVLHELIAIDYYLHYKIKPKARFLTVIDKAERAIISKKFNLNHNKYRYVIHPLHFHLGTFIDTNQILPAHDLLIARYDGRLKPELVLNQERFKL
ncbi:MAG: DUF4080 domain-containing protein [Bacteroidales bacterium]